MLSQLLRRFLRPQAQLLAIVVALQLVATLASLYLPSLNADIIDQGIAAGDTSRILKLGAIMLATTGVQIVCSVAANYAGARAAMSFGRDLRAAVFHRVGEFSARELSRFGAPSLITRTTNDVQQVQMVVMMGCTMLVLSPIMCVGGVVMALREDESLAWLLAIAVPVLAGAVVAIMARMVPQFRLMQPLIDAVNRVLREQITGVRVIRAFVRERAEAARFDRANGDLTETALRIGRLQAMMFPTVIFVFNASSVAVLWFGAHRIAEGRLAIGSMTAFLAYLVQILMSVMMVTFMAVMLPRAAACSERIVEVLNTEPSVRAPDQPVTLVEPTGVVELRDVEYRYPGAELPVLRGISFVARPGQVTAIIGSTGSGKTTLLDLIARLIDPTRGEVRLDGVDARMLALEAVWSCIGLVPQRPFLFSGTVASNLRYGDPAATDEQLWAALAAAQARDFVEAMPQQLDTPIGQGGTNVSGGQRQRLSIARALLRRPRVFLFDDAFSALDVATEARLRAALAERTRAATVILVAQRVSSIVDADQILVLDSGEIVGQGTHGELLASCPTYAEIVASQRDTAVAA
ncbi:ABC transporter ATP-binding protein [Sorangium sp. So ce321]|uniref:ABC transporter ATP-binding protein n=1 Tax=Sorangium sp. So ce321 TaxID=3133300 RepID=UPI003F5EDDE1